jgi:hypothetical protein
MLGWLFFLFFELGGMGFANCKINTNAYMQARVPISLISPNIVGDRDLGV